MELLGLSWSGWVLWLAILVGISTRCLNMWAYGSNTTLARFRHDRLAFRVLMPACGLVIGTLAWSWGAYGTATANLVLAVAALRPDVVRRQRWLADALGTPAGMVVAFVVVPSTIVVAAGGSWEAVQVAGGVQLIVGFLAMLAGAWDGDRSADTWQWLIVCLSVDVLLGAGAVALAAGPIIVLEVMAMSLDLVKARRKVADHHRTRTPSYDDHPSDVAVGVAAQAHGAAARRPAHLESIA